MPSKKMTAARFTASLLLVTTMIAPALAATGTVDTGSSTLRVRSEANTSSQILTKLRNGTQVEVLSAAENGWYQISYGSITGFVSGDYLKVQETAGAAPAEETSSAEVTEVPVETAEESSNATYCRVTASVLNIRSGAGTSYSKVGTARAGRVFEVLAEVDGWYQIEGGYISAEYTIPVDPSSTGKGQEIADYALQFLGYPYVYGGASPKGFDCSGFTKYVYAQFGYTINRTASNQLDNGTPVSMSELQPGDLVMFQKYANSSKRASHVGIYIGNNQFVHASTSEVGVIISDMDYAYYTKGFVGGRRLV